MPLAIKYRDKWNEYNPQDQAHVEIHKIRQKDRTFYLEDTGPLATQETGEEAPPSQPTVKNIPVQKAIHLYFYNGGWFWIGYGPHQVKHELPYDMPLSKIPLSPTPDQALWQALDADYTIKEYERDEKEE